MGYLAGAIAIFIFLCVALVKEYKDIRTWDDYDKNI
jgi:hypothetical protein